MFTNYFKVTWRNLFRHKSFSLVNISGLAIGMASAILILLWIQNEFSYDQFHAKKDRICVLYNRSKFEGKLECSIGVPQVMAPFLKTNYPIVEEVARMNGTAPFTLTVGDRHLKAGGDMTDPGFLKIFSFPLIKGNIETALSTPRSMVITERFAKKLFGNDDPMGKIIRIDSNANFMVTGVLKDPPNNTFFNDDYLIPFTYMKDAGWYNPSWKDINSLTFVLLKPGVTEQMADDRFRDILKTHADGMDYEVFVHPISKWRLYSRFENGQIVGGGIENVRIFGLIAGFILFIACINYMNLSTARSIRRAKEVGIRKVVGARRPSLVMRFLGESILISFLSGILGLAIVQMSIQGFNWLTWKNLTVPYGSLNFWLCMIGFIVLTGIIAGSYPAFYLSSYKPISVLKGTARFRTRTSVAKQLGRSSFKTAYNLVSVRKILVVFQFSFAIAFIICTIVVYRQINFGRKRDPGYNRDRLAFAYVSGEMNKRYRSIKNELLNSGAVTAVTRSNSPITYTWGGDDSYSWSGKNPNIKPYFAEFHVDNDFLSTTGVKLIAGREINTNRYPTDSTAILLNETAANLMAFKNPIGQIVKNGQGNWRVVGVVRDFVPESPLNAVQPAIIQGPKNYQFGAITFRLNSQHPAAADMQKIEAIFRKYNPDYPLIYAFVVDADAEKLEDERRTGIQSALFGGMAILISCLGLFALAAYTTESRIKEIGVRKVLGASVARIATLLSGDFLKLVLISFFIASPLAWWVMHSWLQNYSYHAPIGWLVFVITGLLSMGIALATVGYQAVKAALANPVINLRAE
jgi:ABC-type antimicrobial peptide transport system permease subunit